MAAAAAAAAVDKNDNDRLTVVVVTSVDKQPQSPPQLSTESVDRPDVDPAAGAAAAEDATGVRRTTTLHVIDSLLCLFVFFPSMLMYWRGIWDLYGVYIYPHDELRCNWGVFALGSATLIGYYAHPALGAALKYLKHRGDTVGDVTAGAAAELKRIENGEAASPSTEPLVCLIIVIIQYTCSFVGLSSVRQNRFFF